MDNQNKLVLALELVQRDLARISLKVDSVEHCMNQQNILVDSMVTTLRRIIGKDY